MARHPKIKDPIDLAIHFDLIRKAGAKIVLCHGVFDIVHPGHIRHLLYAKSRADFLVVSLTSDRFVNKAIHRPFVPQELRALNLAVLEMVDYVIVNDAETPLALINMLKPAYYAKGYEYMSRGISSATQAEMDAVSECGGEMLFTPGDVVYASSKLVRPDLCYDKLKVLMDEYAISFGELRKALHYGRGFSVHVIGDTILDRIHHSFLLGASGKTPTLSVQHMRTESFLGGAAIVARHLAATGMQVSFSTVLGDDDAGVWVRNELHKVDMGVNAFSEPSRPTTVKDVFVCAGQRLLKSDVVDNRSISADTLAALIKRVAMRKNAVVFSDFRHGIFNPVTIPLLRHAVPHGSFVVADSQVASRWGNILEFVDCDLITPNEREARFSLGDQDSGILPLLQKLVDKSQANLVIMKLGANGAVLGSLLDPPRYHSLDSFTSLPVDPVGAGDALLAYALLGMMADARGPVSLILGSIAAALECEAEGNVPITLEAMEQRILEIEKCV